VERNLPDDTLPAFERDRPAVPPQLAERRNMRDGIVHGAFFHMATAFADPYAIIPLFLAGFSDSRILIGFVVSLVSAATVLPQLFVAGHLRRHPGIAKRLMLGGIWTRCAVWGLIAAIVLIVPEPGTIVLVAFMIGVSIYSLAGGVVVLPFKQVVSETIAPEHRSSFFGWRLVFGGIMSILAGLLVKQLLGMQSMPWPRNYGVLFLMSFASLAVAYTAMSRFRFPPLPDRERTPQKSHRQALKHAWRDYPVLKRIILIRLLSGGLSLALPFFTLYATQEVGLSLASVGLFVAAQRGGGIVSNLFWIPLGNRTGTKPVILAGLLLAILSVAAILFSETMLAITISFALAGGAMSAMTVGFSGYILELGSKEIRPLLFALEGTLLLPLYFMPLLGGWVADTFGFDLLLIVAAMLLITALIAAATLCEPRRGASACGPGADQPASR